MPKVFITQPILTERAQVDSPTVTVTDCSQMPLKDVKELIIMLQKAFDIAQESFVANQDMDMPKLNA